MISQLRALLAVGVLAATLTSCARATPVDQAPISVGAVSVVSDLRRPMVVAHRGGAAIYPEETMVGFEAAAADGYYPEMDVQFLADGTPVLVHDDSADRTMLGVRGPIDEITSDEWSQARVKSPTGGASEPAAFLTELLDDLGGEIVLVPEIKPGATPGEVDAVLAEIRARGLEESVLVQSFDYATSERVAAAGVPSLHLLGDDPGSVTPERLEASGIEWVGVSRNMSAEDIGNFSRGGSRVLPYTLPTRTEGEALSAEVFGFFTDDPWT